MRDEIGLWPPGRHGSWDGPLLLDTHLWIWYVEGDGTRVASSLRATLESAEKARNLRVLDISYWEVAVKSAKGKLEFAIDPTVWLNRASKATGIRYLPLDRDILLLSTRLPGTAPSDPADRMLLAAAQLEGMPLVTADHNLIAYAELHPGFPVIDARC